MILYLDTSSLVKLYVEEEGSAMVSDLVDAGRAVGTSIIAYAEARAAFARRFREKAIIQADYKRLVNGFDRDWGRYFVVHVDQVLIRSAGRLAEKHALRGFDAIHLASALLLKKEMKEAPVFSSFDDRLQRASRLEKLAQP